jgi:hypothetical protein
MMHDDAGCYLHFTLVKCFSFPNPIAEKRKLQNSYKGCVIVLNISYKPCSCACAVIYSVLVLLHYLLLLMFSSHVGSSSD